MSHSKFAQPQPQPTSFIKKTKNGKPNSKYVDLLEVDKQISVVFRLLRLKKSLNRRMRFISSNS